MKIITTIGDLRIALAEYSDNDNVVIEIHDGEGHERTREFYIKKVRFYESGNAESNLIDGNEVRFCI